MSYRDDLEAAHARIAALEQQVSGGAGTMTGESLGPLFDRLAELERQLADRAILEAEVVKLRGLTAKVRLDHEALVAGIRARLAEVPSDLPTLAEANRTVTIDPEKRVTHVNACCTICFVMFGERIPMENGNPYGMEVSSKNTTTVTCRRCGYSGIHLKASRR